ncbi:uncharacterized protein N0V89_008963 [Didymosphaeria variabile]|uniref:Uncharacterized protein n=1 Tax=Didymosphaeria variabile TaxID=1932322 RepID=A0A9W8XIL2_9PLEO|nr:uncharacterized protein N0V89_008963 [Didymosphaeria variabile]KAJ4350342.1 hypothetical protein N0V89_008963 [Didymosphaeria variabile]
MRPLEEPKDKWKGCECIELSDESDVEYTAYSDSELEQYGTFFDQLPSSDSDKPREHPSNNPACQSDNANGPLPDQLVTDAGNKKPSELQYMMRETLCNNKCELPQGLPAASVATTKDGNDGCEIAIILPNNVEAWAYRATQSTGPQWQDCWDSFANITEKCVKNDPATGWVNGPDDYQFYQSGIRPLNGDGSKHGQLDGSNALKDATPSQPSPPTPTETIGLSPTGDGINCLSNDQGGWLWDCGDIVNKFGDDEQICTNDSKYCSTDLNNIGESYCKASGAKCDSNGSGTMKISSYCAIATSQSCSLVIADKLASFGFPGSSCITGRDIKNFIAAERSADGCGGPPDQGRIAMAFANNGAATWCLAGSKAPGICAA